MNSIVAGPDFSPVVKSHATPAQRDPLRDARGSARGPRRGDPRRTPRGVSAGAGRAVGPVERAHAQLGARPRGAAESRTRGRTKKRSSGSLKSHATTALTLGAAISIRYGTELSPEIAKAVSRVRGTKHDMRSVIVVAHGKARVSPMPHRLWRAGYRCSSLPPSREHARQTRGLPGTGGWTYRRAAHRNHWGQR